jgi:hypothetical protein
MAGLAPAIPLNEKPPCHMIGITGSSPAMTAGDALAVRLLPPYRWHLVLVPPLSVEL